MKDYMEQALFTLREVPDRVLIALAKDEDIAQAIISSGAPLSDGVFTHLWNIYRTYEDDAESLLERRLTRAQRVLVLGAKPSTRLLSTIIEFNDLTPKEFSSLKTTFTDETADRLLRRYLPEDRIMKHVVERLPYRQYIRATLRSSPEVCSDEDVLAAIKSVSAQSAPADATEKQHLGIAMRDALEKRPHLLPKMCRLLVKSRAHCLRHAIAESRYVGDHKVLLAVLGKEPQDIAEGSLSMLHASVRYALLKNPVVPPFVRFAIMRSEPTRLEGYVYKTAKSQIAQDIGTVTNQEELNTLIDRALAKGVPYHDNPKQDWDVLELAKNPNLPLARVEGVFEHLTLHEVLVHLGPARCQSARDSLESLYIIRTAWKGRKLGGVRTALRDRFIKGEGLDIVYPPVELSDPVAVAFTKSIRFVARPLVDILGDDPVSWLTFLVMLDTADPNSTLRRVAETSARLAVAP